METRVLPTACHATRVTAATAPPPAVSDLLFRVAWAVLLLAVVLGPAATAVAQGTADSDELPMAILAKDGAWNAAEARTVEAFIATNLEPFADETADAEAIAEARERLLLPLNDLRAVPAFQAQYFRALAAALRNGLGDFTKIGRLNAMMLGSRIVDASAIQLLEVGADDEAPGVRYAAARSLLSALNNEAMGLRDAEKTRLIRKLGEAAGTETDGFVAGKLIEAIRAAEVDAQSEVLLTLFNDRVSIHAANPRLTYQPELTAMQELFINGLADGFDRDAARTFIQAAARYIRLTTSQLADDSIPTGNQQAAINLANQSFTVLDTLAPNAGQPGQRPGNPARLLPADPSAAADLAEQWPAFLAAAPLSLNGDELGIASPEAPADADPEG